MSEATKVQQMPRIMGRVRTHNLEKKNRLHMPLLFITTVLTGWAVKAAYAERGYWAIGGEALVPLIVWGLWWLARKWKEA